MYKTNKYKCCEIVSLICTICFTKLFWILLSINFMEFLLLDKEIQQKRSFVATILWQNIVQLMVEDKSY